MEMFDRIRQLRKQHLNMTQKEFGAILGVSRSVINNIESNALAKPEQKLSLVKLMCKEFGINEAWIIDGTEPMITPKSNDVLDALAKEYDLSQSDYAVVEKFINAKPEKRKVLIELVKNMAAAIEGIEASGELTDILGTPEELEKHYPPVKPSNKK